MMARLTMLQWLQDGEIEPAEAEHFENQLYKLYKPWCFTCGDYVGQADNDRKRPFVAKQS